MKSGLIAKLSSRTGTYEGRGINHEGQSFTGRLVLAPVLAGLGVALQFRATGDDGTVFHQEVTTIAPTMSGGVGLFNLNTNMPGLVPHELTREDRDSNGNDLAVFAFGERSRTHEFREEITVELHPDGSIGYKYAWGMPGGQFSDRSGAVMAILPTGAV